MLTALLISCLCGIEVSGHPAAMLSQLVGVTAEPLVVEVAPGETQTITVVGVPSVPQTFSVTAPAPGDVLTAGTSYTVQWQSSLQLGVRIKLRIANIFVSWVANNPVTEGAYVWQIPVDMAPGSDYTIQVVRTDGSKAVSGVFTIVAPPPVEGEGEGEGELPPPSFDVSMSTDGPLPMRFTWPEQPELYDGMLVVLRDGDNVPVPGYAPAKLSGARRLARGQVPGEGEGEYEETSVTFLDAPTLLDWKIPDGLPPGSYRLTFHAAFMPEFYGASPVFEVQL